MTESTAEKAEINIIVDASTLSWGEFVAISGAGDEVLEPAEMVKMVNKMIVNQDEINQLPFLDVFEALQDVLALEFTQVSSSKN